MASWISQLLGRQERSSRGPSNKVLRIGIIRGPRIVDERLVRIGQDVTVGESERNTFVLPPSHLPPSHKLFVARPDGYYLAFDERMRGKVFTDGAVCPLDQLATRARRHRGLHLIKLSPSNRGKIQVGDVTVLFQFVQAPPEPRRVVVNFSPLSFGQVDWVFTCFVIFSFIVNIAGYLYLESQPPPGKVNIDQIPERMADVWFPNEFAEDPEDLEIEDGPEIDETVPADDEPRDDTGDALADDGEPSSPGGGDQDEPADTRTAEQIRAEREAQLRGEGLAALLLTTNSHNNNGTNALDGLVELDGLADDLDEAFGAEREVRHASLVDLPGGTRQDGAGEGEARTQEFTEGFGSGPAGEGHRDQHEVTPIFEPDTPFVDPGVEVSSVTAVVEKKKGKIQSCYERYLKMNPELQGTVEVLIVVAADGSVDEVLVERNTTGSRELGTCIASGIRRWNFPATGETYEIAYPFNLFPG